MKIKYLGIILALSSYGNIKSMINKLVLLKSRTIVKSLSKLTTSLKSGQSPKMSGLPFTKSIKA